MSTAGKHRRTIRVRLADAPGSLHHLTGLVAEAGADIVRLEIVSHEHDDVWDDIELAADHPGRLDAVVAAIRASGLAVIGLPASWALRDWAVEILHSLEALGEVTDESTALEQFADAAARLANSVHALVLIEPGSSDAQAASTRWELIKSAAQSFDPDTVKWSGNPLGIKFVSSAMKVVRTDPLPDTDSGPEPVGAVVRLPAPGKRPAHLAVIGRRPPFLAAELERLELFARVGAPHITALRWETSA